MQANTQAINVLKHSLREAPKAAKLKNIRPEPKWFQRYGRGTQALANTAACIAVVLLLKVGVFSSMDTFQKQGKKTVEQYYAKHLGPDLAKDIFKT